MKALKKEERFCFMSYGSFDFEKVGYHITTPRTPTAWKMPLFNDNYFTFVDQLLQGKGYFITPKTYVKSQATAGNREFWLRDRNSGKVWKINDSKATEDYDFCHYLNRAELTRHLDGIVVKVCIFVPVDKDVEYWKVSIKNETDTVREVSLFTYTDLGTKNVMGGTCIQKGNAIIKYAYPGYTLYEEKEKCDKKRERFYLISDTKPNACDMSKQRFYGGYLCDDVPKAVKEDACSNIPGEVEAFCGAMQHIVSLEAGEEKEICFSLGAEVKEGEILTLANQFTSGLVNQALVESENYWTETCANSEIQSPNPEFDALINFWLKKQIVLLTRLNRRGDVCPIRNQLQDAMGYSLIAPEEAKQFMFNVFSLQRKDGYIKQWRSTSNGPAKGLILLEHCDGPIWITLCGCILVSQLGDAGVLEEKVPYSDGGEGSLLEHFLMAVRYMSQNVGVHGIGLMRDGDWTDPINGIGRGGKGESAWTSMGTMLIAKWLKELCEETGHEEYIDELETIWQETDATVNLVLWENDRYIGGFDDDGIPFANQEDDNRILLNVQTWALISGAARGERAAIIKDTIASISGKLGPYTIYPGFTEYNPRWGRISLKQNGTTENGAVYCHADMFKAFSDVAFGDGDGMYDSILRVTPLHPENPVENHGQVPLYLPNYYYSLEGSDNFGRSSGAYGTGSAAWMLVTVLEQLYGLQATTEGMRLRPNLPEDWDEVSCTRRYKDAIYEVRYTKSVSSIQVNGKEFVGDVLPYEANMTYHIIYGLK